MTRRFYSNLAPAVMTTGSISAAATSVTVSSLTGFPASFPYTVAIERGTASEELLLVTAAVGTSATITRGYGGTTPKAHATSVSFEHVVDATDADEANLHVNATSGVHGVSGVLVGTTDVQTVTAKTFTSSTVQATSTDPALVSKAAASGTQPHLIGKDSAGSITEWQVFKGGGASFKNTDVQALTATTVSASGAISGPAATISGPISATTGTFSGAVGAGGAITGPSMSVTGAAVVGGNATVTGSVTANNMGGRVARISDSTLVTSSGTTEVIGSGQPQVTLVSGRRYRFNLYAVVSSNVANDSVYTRLRISTNAVTVGSGQVCQTQDSIVMAGGPGQMSVTACDEFVAGANGVHRLAVGMARRDGSGNASCINWYAFVDDVGV